MPCTIERTSISGFMCLLLIRRMLSERCSGVSLVGHLAAFKFSF